MRTTGNGGMMYRTRSAQETNLARMIRKSTACPCWARHADMGQCSEKLHGNPALSPAPPADVGRDETA